MSCPLNKERLDHLKLFVDACTKNPEILHNPALDFFKTYVESLGGKIPESSAETPSCPASNPGNREKSASPDEQRAEEALAEDSEPDSDLELDTEGCVEPDQLSDDQKMGDPDKEVTEEESDKADEKRCEAMAQFNEGNADKAIELYTEAIELNPQSALLFAKRGQAYIKKMKPNACIKDCTRALELNPDSAGAYKFRGRAFRLLGEWEKAAKDLRQACNIDFDEQTNEWLKEITPNATKIEQHKLKQERKKQEKEKKAKLEKIKKAKEAHARAADATQGEAREGAAPAGAPGMGDFYKLLQDPEIMAAFQDPEVAAAFQDILVNPANFIKYQSNPKVMAIVTKLSSKLDGSAMNFPGFPGAGGFPGFPGFGGGAANPPPPTTRAPEDDNLD